MTKYFVMMYNQAMTTIMPIIEGSDEDDNNDVKLYNSYEEADNEMKDHYYASNFGYEIFEIEI